MTCPVCHAFTLNLVKLVSVFAVLCGLLLVPCSMAQNPPKDRLLVQPDSTDTSRGKRIALVIGNGDYTNAPPLKNPPNDARDMAGTLKDVGFDVVSGINVSQREMKSLIRNFGQKLKTSSAGVFYYAGHGVQSKGRNYLIPIEADIQSEAEVEDASVDVNLILNYMDDAQNDLNIVILDACRNNPFARSFRSASNGLAQVEAPTGTLIAYATAPGRVASDGLGRNGLYTSELLKHMRVPGLSITDMLMRVRAEVMKQTSGRQVPWEASSLVGSFYFTAGAKPNTSEGAKIDSVAVEREYWETIRNSNDAQNFREYLQTYPNGAYAVIARAKIRQLEESGRPSDGGPSVPKTLVKRRGEKSARVIVTWGINLRPSNSGIGSAVYEFTVPFVTNLEKAGLTVIDRRPGKWEWSQSVITSSEPSRVVPERSNDPTAIAEREQRQIDGIDALVRRGGIPQARSVSAAVLIWGSFSVEDLPGYSNMYVSVATISFKVIDLEEGKTITAEEVGEIRGFGNSQAQARNNALREAVFSVPQSFINRVKESAW